jgi:hypothetical protein
MSENPYADGKIRGTADGVVRGIVFGIAILTAWNAPFAWYWRIAIFVLIMFLISLIYPKVQLALVKRKHRRRIAAEEAVSGEAKYQAMVRQMHPDIAADADETREFRATMAAMTDAYRDKPKG